jgi:2-amino-4-hydroxy-6-hydroxymethyldihydropteridine diphosphokinase
MPVKQVYLSLGSNLGDRRQNLEQAKLALAREHVEVVAQSSIYETEPQDVTDQPWFLNMVVECRTNCFPMQLLAILKRIEREMGRIRVGTPRRGPRVIDLDILLFGTGTVQTAQLQIPHPRMSERRFVLQPLLEIAPEIRDPRSREPLAKALARLRGQTVKRLLESSAS